MRGYFLVNLVVTVGVIALLAAVSAPTLRSYLPALRLRNEARALISELREAQQRTLTGQVAHYVVVDTANNRYQLFTSDEPGTPLRTTGFDGGVTVDEVNGLTDDTATFNAYGAALESGSIVLVNELNATSTVIIKPSGYVQLQ